MQEQALSLDAFLGGRLSLYQPQKGYRAGIDAVLLAAVCPVEKGDHVADFGAGVGTVGLSIAARVQDIQLTLIEAHNEIAEIAGRNIAQNDFPTDKMRVITADLTESIAHMKTKGLDGGQFHHIVMNPPFYDKDKSSSSMNEYQNHAHMQEKESLAKWFDIATWALKSKGSLSIIYPAEGLADILQLMQNRFGAIHILPLATKANMVAKRVIVQAFRDKKTPLTLHPPLVLHQQNGDYTAQIEGILREGKRLVFV